MMARTALVVFLALLLASCIPVKDFGVYWNKGVIDQALAGVWDKTEKDLASPQKVASKVVVENNTYRIDSMDEQDLKQEDYKPVIARTLKAGGYTFLMVLDDGQGPKGGDLVRYTLKDGVLKTYESNAKSIGKWIKKHHPKATNIDASEDKGDFSIKTLDDAVYGALSDIPDTAEYWKPVEEYRRRPG
jgi:hypothetical protein